MGKEKESIKDLVRKILIKIGENPDREGLLDTPERVEKMYREVFRGYDKEQMPKVTVFNNGKDGISYDQMIIDKGYFFSHCEHHMVPFFGEYAFGYIPDKKFVGISKISRILDYFSAKLQVQERLTVEVVDYFEKILKPKGIILVITARHLCKEMRGIKKYNSTMTTSEVRGVFRANIQTKEEFFNLIK